MWQEEASCIGMDTDLFFDKYEEDEGLRPAIDELCRKCPVQRTCFAVAVSWGGTRDDPKAYGVFGGIFLKDGKISKEMNNHKTKIDWYNTWESLVMEKS